MCGCGETGRRAGFKIRFRKECRFDSDHPHHHFRRPVGLTWRADNSDHGRSFVGCTLTIASLRISDHSLRATRMDNAISVKVRTLASHIPPNQASRFQSLGAVFSVISSFIDLASEHPIGPCGVGDDDRDEYARTDEHEDLASFRCGGIPDRHPPRNNVGPYRNSQSCY